MDVGLANSFEPERGAIGFKPEETERWASIELTEASFERDAGRTSLRRNPFVHIL